MLQCPGLRWLLLISVLGLGQPVHAAPPAQSLPPLITTFTPARCPVNLSFGEIEGQTIQCGFISVPSDYAQAASPALTLTVAIARSSSLSPMPDPVIYLEGGPGASAITNLGILPTLFSSLRQTRDVILFDQRGTRYGTPLDCAAEYLAQESAIHEAISKLGLEASDAQKTRVRLQLTAQICAAALRARGIDLTQYNSINSARDVAALMEALSTAFGYPQYNLYGISYGTRLALEVMRSQPQRLRSVVLDSVYPPNIRAYERMPERIGEVLSTVVATCVADATCNASYPDLKAQFAAVTQRLASGPIETEDGVSVTLAGLDKLAEDMNRTRLPLFTPPGITAYVPRILAELSRGDTRTYGQWQSGSIPPPAPAITPVPTDTTGLPPDIARRLNEAVTQAQQATDLLNAARRQYEDALQASRQADPNQARTPGQEFQEKLSFYLYGPAGSGDKQAASRDYLLLTLQPATKETLLRYVDEHFSGQDASSFRALVEDMRPSDVAQMFAAARNDLLTRSAEMVYLAAHLSVECFEEIPFNQMSVTERTAQNSFAPGLAQADVETAQEMALQCAAWNTGRANEAFKQPVVSDIPTLVLAGDNDTQTPKSWSTLATQTLSRSVRIEVPNAGHGVIGFSKCAADLAAAFVSQPERPPMTTCLAALRVQFVGP